jgi:hypothetical protein
MITAKQIGDVLQARPFRSLLSDGGTRDIRTHDSAMVLKNYVEVGFNPDAEGIAQNVARCSILHITRIEDPPETLAPH